LRSFLVLKFVVVYMQVSSTVSESG
jgi:hypothetical protein